MRDEPARGARARRRRRWRSIEDEAQADAAPQPRRRRREARADRLRHDGAAVDAAARCGDAAAHGARRQSRRRSGGDADRDGHSRARTSIAPAYTREIAALIARNFDLTVGEVAGGARALRGDRHLVPARPAAAGGADAAGEGAVQPRRRDARARSDASRRSRRSASSATRSRCSAREARPVAAADVSSSRLESSDLLARAAAPARPDHERLANNEFEHADGHAAACRR